MLSFHFFSELLDYFFQRN